MIVFALTTTTPPIRGADPVPFSNPTAMPELNPVPVIVTLTAVPGLAVFGVIDVTVTAPQTPSDWTVLAVGLMWSRTQEALSLSFVSKRCSAGSASIVRS